MCPVCIPNLAVALVGLTSTSGLAALVWRRGLSLQDGSSYVIEEETTTEQSEITKE
jgi:hypothetical protein